MKCAYTLLASAGSAKPCKINNSRAYRASVQVQHLVPRTQAATLNPRHAGGEQVLLSFVNNWGTTGGVDQFVAWSPTASIHQHFFTDAGCRAMYRASVAAVVNRVNSINGRRCLLGAA